MEKQENKLDISKQDPKKMLDKQDYKSYKQEKKKALEKQEKKQFLKQEQLLKKQEIIEIPENLVEEDITVEPSTELPMEDKK